MWGICTHPQNTGVLLRNNKEWNFAICDKIGGSRGYYAKWSKSHKKDTYCMTSFICEIEKKNHIDTENRLVVAGVEGVRGWVREVGEIKSYKHTVTK